MFDSKKDDGTDIAVLSLNIAFTLTVNGIYE